MGKPSRRPNREEIKALNKERKAAQKALRVKQRAEGMVIPSKPSIPNRKSQFKSVEEEQVARQFAATEQARIFQSQLPGLLKTISKIKDLRKPKKIKHKMDLLIMYGILTFVYQMASRREANRDITKPQFMVRTIPKITSHFSISASGHLRSSLNREPIGIAHYSCDFTQS